MEGAFPARSSAASASKTALALLQQRGRAVDLGGEALQRARGDDGLLLRRLPVALLEGLPHAGQRLDPVAGVEAGRVDLVPEPGADGQAFRTRQRLLGVHQYLV